MVFKIFFMTIFIIAIHIALHEISASPNDWKTVERLMEENPYIVAILNHTFDYVCTGTIVSKIAVLTSGHCVTLNPKHVAVGVAVVGKKTTKSSILDVAYTRLHSDYNFEMNAVETNEIRIHSNIGVVFVVRPILEMFIPAAEIGNYYSSELQDIELTTVGFGGVSGTRDVVLQYESYNQAPCANPRWYYCICGNEASNTSNTYERDFGSGAPVLYGDEVVGVTASASGSLSHTVTGGGVKFNVFTVIGPYLAWIEKTQVNTTLNMRAKNGANISQDTMKFVYLLLIINKMCN